MFLMSLQIDLTTVERKWFVIINWIDFLIWLLNSFKWEFCETCTYSSSWNAKIIVISKKVDEKKDVSLLKIANDFSTSKIYCNRLITIEKENNEKFLQTMLITKRKTMKMISENNNDWKVIKFENEWLFETNVK